MNEILWTPSPHRAASSNLGRFMERHGFEDYDALHRWSIEHMDDFWRAVWDDGEVMADGTPAPALASRDMPGAVWFPDVRLNFAENLLRRTGDDLAVVAADESGTRTDVTAAELHQPHQRQRRNRLARA